MKTNYILRAYTDNGMHIITDVSSLISKELNVSIEIIDHRNPDPKEFLLSRFNINNVISLDKHLAQKFNCKYFQISRIFNEKGCIVGRRIGKIDMPINHHWHIIDTDIETGSTIQLASEILHSESYVAPIKIPHDTDLIDMEDLIFENSLLQWSNLAKIDKCSYLLNSEFFSCRTSLPEFLYNPIIEILGE